MKIKPGKKSPIRHPKPKGKYPKEKKIRKAAGKKFDVFETLLNSDAGAGSSRQSFQAFVDEAEKLSKPQLSRLEKKIQKIQSRLIKTKKNGRKRKKRHAAMMQWIEDRRQYSEIEEDLLRRQIRRKIRRYKITPSASRRFFLIGDKQYSLRKLAYDIFPEELAQIKADLEKSVLLSPHSRYGALGVFKHLLQRSL